MSDTSFKLSNGHSIPAVGFGTWKSKPDDAYRSVITALKTGYRHIDTAWIYGNEPDVGRAIKDSGVKREDIFLTTKLWSTYHTRVQENTDLSLKQLGVDYLDLYLMHWPVALNPNGNPPTFPMLEGGKRDLQDRDFRDTWAEMVECQKSGKVRAIGVANFDIHNLEELRKTSDTVPAVNQVEMNPYLQQPKLKEYCAKNNIHVTAYSPLGSAGNPLKEDKVVLDIAKKHGVDPCAVLLAWGVKAGHSVIPKSITDSRIRDNFVQVDLSEEEVKSINGLDKGERLCKPEWGVTVFHDE